MISIVVLILLNPTFILANQATIVEVPHKLVVYPNPLIHITPIASNSSTSMSRTGQATVVEEQMDNKNEEIFRTGPNEQILMRTLVKLDTELRTTNESTTDSSTDVNSTALSNQFDWFLILFPLFFRL